MHSQLLALPVSTKGASVVRMALQAARILHRRGSVCDRHRGVAAWKFTGADWRLPVFIREVLSLSGQFR